MRTPNGISHVDELAALLELAEVVIEEVDVLVLVEGLESIELKEMDPEFVKLVAVLAEVVGGWTGLVVPSDVDFQDTIGGWETLDVHAFE
jgi:hypothetical protein